MVAVVRWKLRDTETGTTYTVPINPNQMTSIIGRKGIQARNTTQGVALLYDGPRTPFEMTAQGVILEKVHFDTLNTWFKKNARLELTDHFKRKTTVVITGFEPIPEARMSHPWRHTYTLTFLVLTDFVYVA